MTPELSELLNKAFVLNENATERLKQAEEVTLQAKANLAKSEKLMDLVDQRSRIAARWMILTGSLVIINLVWLAINWMQFLRGI